MNPSLNRQPNKYNSELGFQCMNNYLEKQTRNKSVCLSDIIRMENSLVSSPSKRSINLTKQRWKANVDESVSLIVIEDSKDNISLELVNTYLEKQVRREI